MSREGPSGRLVKNVTDERGANDALIVRLWYFDTLWHAKKRDKRSESLRIVFRTVLLSGVGLGLIVGAAVGIGVEVTIGVGVIL